MSIFSGSVLRRRFVPLERALWRSWCTWKSHQKVISVSVLGAPNSGKSTLINSLSGGVRIRPVSRKPHTTRFNARAVITRGDSQILLLDTPGVVSSKEASKFNLKGSVITDPEASGGPADLFLVLQDISNVYARDALNKEVLKILCLYPETPSVLVLNKLDKVPHSKRIYDLIRRLTRDSLGGTKSGTEKIRSEQDIFRKFFPSERKKNPVFEDRILIRSFDELISSLKKEEDPIGKRAFINDLVADLPGWPGFIDVFTISALTGDGVDCLTTYLLESCKPGSHVFPPDVKTDIGIHQLVRDTVKSKFLEFLDFDIPYILNPVIEDWKIDNETYRISVAVESSHPRITKHILKRKLLKEISSSVEKDLQNFFEAVVFLRINVRVLHPRKEPVNQKRDTSYDLLF